MATSSKITRSGTMTATPQKRMMMTTTTINVHGRLHAHCLCSLRLLFSTMLTFASKGFAVLSFSEHSIHCVKPVSIFSPDGTATMRLCSSCQEFGAWNARRRCSARCCAFVYLPPILLHGWAGVSLCGRVRGWPEMESCQSALRSDPSMRR